jgi:hypothetical protein
MPDWLHTDDLKFDRIPLGPFDTRLWWLLIGVCIILVFTIQAIETAIEGAWPNQRRPGRMLPRARWVQASWAFVALFVLAGALLTISNVALLIWKNPPHPNELSLGSWLLGIGWVLFLLFSLNALGLGRLMGNLGLIGPLAIVTILIVGDILLLIAFQHLFPSIHDVRDGIENGLKQILPFWG